MMAETGRVSRRVSDRLSYTGTLRRYISRKPGSTYGYIHTTSGRGAWRRRLNLIALAFAAAVLGTVNFVYVAQDVGIILSSAEPWDWWVYGQAVERIDGGMYEWSGGYRHRYPPLFAYAIAPFTWLGLDAWRLLHVAALAFLPWRIALLVALSFPFVNDTAHASMMVFALVLGWHALAGSRPAFYGFLIVALLVPRPLMFPVIGWLLWQRPELRLPTFGIAAVYGALTLATGETAAFLSALGGSSDAFDYPSNWGPSRIIGWAGVPISLALGIWLTWRGRLGLASVAISPYIVPYYWIMLWLEARPRSP